MVADVVKSIPSNNTEPPFMRLGAYTGEKVSYDLTRLVRIAEVSATR